MNFDVLKAVLSVDIKQRRTDYVPISELEKEASSLSQQIKIKNPLTALRVNGFLISSGTDQSVLTGIFAHKRLRYIWINLVRSDW